VNPNYAKIVELRYFVGLTIPEVANAIDVPERTVKRHWEFARRFLFRELEEFCSSMFREHDIKDLSAIIDQWRGPSNAVSAFLWQSLSKQDQIALMHHQESATSSNQAKAVVVQALNRIIGGPGIYESTRFQGISLRAETSELVKAGPTGPSLARLNRLLLEDAYPRELSRKRQLDGH
jgi:hypothetical protein